MKEYRKNHDELILIPSLYEASTKHFYDTIEELADKYESAALFSHNPGISDFINSLEIFPVYDMPTCAVYALEIDTNEWKEFKDADKKFLFFDYPKK
jgi:phosphohistidine phosphatase